MPQAPEQDSPRSSAERLARLVHRRWALHVLAEVGASGGAKLVTLVNRTGATPAAARASAEHLVSMGLLAKPSGMGHPLRPEYMLGPRASPVADAAGDVVRWIDRRDAADTLLRKWSLPTLWVLHDAPKRFGMLRDGLPTITDRALSMSLSELGGANFVDYRSLDSRPPANEYRLARRARSLAVPLDALVRAG
ncbi:MAG: winged helix-turn-helix transcriptional regulator [Planctomycetota bacterium]